MGVRLDKGVVKEVFLKNEENAKIFLQLLNLLNSSDWGPGKRRWKSATVVVLKFNEISFFST